MNHVGFRNRGWAIRHSGDTIRNVRPPSRAAMGMETERGLGQKIPLLTHQFDRSEIRFILDFPEAAYAGEWECGGKFRHDGVRPLNCGLTAVLVDIKHHNGFLLFLLWLSLV